MAKSFALCLLALALLPRGVCAASGKPLVLIFPTGAARLAPVTEKKDTPDGIDDSGRMELAARAVRKALDDEGTVETLLFSPDTPSLQRALQESKVHLDHGAEPSEDERLRIGSACGAAYVIAVTTLLSTETDAKAATLQMEAAEIRGGKTPSAGKRWKDAIRMGGSSTPLASRRGPSNVLQTAARTLVLRFLNGPLRELHVATPRPEFLPQPPKPGTVAAEAVESVSAQEQAKQVRVNGEALIHDGNFEDGIRTLRRAVNLAPRDLSVRMALVRAYLGAKRTADAADEATRTLSVADFPDAGSRQEMAQLLAQSLRESGDPTATRQGYEQILRADPKNVPVRLALADLLLTQEDATGAEEHLRIARRDAPENPEAALGMARLLASRGDYDGALKELSGDANARHAFVTALFLETATRIANRLIQNRAAWQEEKLTREAFYTATQAQAAKANTLPGLLNAAPPPTGATSSLIQAYKHRLLAASLLNQSLASQLQYLETGEASASAQSRVLLDEFFVEMKAPSPPSDKKPAGS